jgi:NADH-quinone oxidoreductase subunit A
MRKLSAMIFSVLANQLPPMESSWIPVLILIVVGILFAVINIIASITLGPSKTGPGKETTYESGMVPIGDTRKRFNVRFYVVAMIFLVFDVEIVFFYPWAVLFSHEIVRHAHSLATPMIISMGVFVLILLIAYFYAWGKGVFRWD